MFNASELLKKVMITFKGSFINNNFELILVPNTNLYICLGDVRNDIDLKCKLLEWCSRDCYKSQPYERESRNNEYNQYVLNNINEILGTNFDYDDMDIIYTKLGNCCHHKLVQKFVIRDYDMNILKRKD